MALMQGSSRIQGAERIRTAESPKRADLYEVVQCALTERESGRLGSEAEPSWGTASLLSTPDQDSWTPGQSSPRSVSASPRRKWVVG